MRQSVETDIAGLKMLLGELGMAKTDLSMQIDSLRDELESMKRNHEEVRPLIVAPVLEETHFYKKGANLTPPPACRTWPP